MGTNVSVQHTALVYRAAGDNTFLRIVGTHLAHWADYKEM
jgi:hypothetical protein